MTKQLTKLQPYLNKITEEIKIAQNRFAALRDLITAVSEQSEFKKDTQTALSACLVAYKNCANLSEAEKYALLYLEAIYNLIKLEKKNINLRQGAFIAAINDWTKFKFWCMLLKGLRGYGISTENDGILLQITSALKNKDEKSVHEKYALWILVQNLFHRSPHESLEAIVNRLPEKKTWDKASKKNYEKMIKLGLEAGVNDDLFTDDRLQELPLEGLAELLDYSINPIAFPYQEKLVNALRSKKNHDGSLSLASPLLHQLDLYILKHCPDNTFKNMHIKEISGRIESMELTPKQLENLCQILEASTTILAHKADFITQLRNLSQKAQSAGSKIQSPIFAQERATYIKWLKDFEKYPDCEERDRRNIPDNIHHLVGDLAYQGQIFSKNHPWARRLYERAVAEGITAAKSQLARMYFYAEGGPLQYEVAVRLITEVQTEQPGLSDPTWLELLADHHYLQYLHSQDAKSPKAEHLTHCTKYLQQLGNARAVNYLWMLLHHENAGQAAIALITLYQKDPTQFSEKTLKRKKNENFIWYLCERAERLGSYASIPATLQAGYRSYQESAGEKEEQLNQLNERLYNEYIEPLFEKEQQFNPYDTLREHFQKACRSLAATPGLKKSGIDRLLRALSELTEGKGSVTLRRFDYLQAFPKEVQEKLTTFLQNVLFHYYSSEQVKNPEETLLTIVCYEGIHAGESSIEYTMMRAVLEKKIPDYQAMPLEELKTHLAQLETKKGVYFDEATSDDSDSDDDKTYRGTNDFLTADISRRQDLFGGIGKVLKKHLGTLEKKELKPDEENSLRDRFHAEFAPSARYSRTQKPFRVGISGGTLSCEIRDDLAKINDYKIRGQLIEGLAFIKTPFVVAQTRGVHSFLQHWGATNRRKMRRRIYEAEHPIHSKPVYSHAVYKRAHISDYSDLNGITYLRLEKIALHVYRQILSISSEPIPADADWVRVRRYPTTTNLLRIQQLYSESHSDFHDKYLSWLESKNIQLSGANPCLSTGDIESEHSIRYAFGEKVYAGSEGLRLRPKYQRDGRPLRPYSGYVLLLICPLEDYIRGDSNHVPSLMRKAEVMVRLQVLAERENTFMVKLGEGRLAFMVSAKFPSFHHETYPKIFKLKYGITRETYLQIKRILASTKPHEPKRRLLIDLLGTYLSTYNQLYLLRYAYEQTTLKFLANDEGEGKGRGILVFRDCMGNFSFNSTLEINPTPKGSDEREQLQVLATLQARVNRKRAADQQPADQSESEGDTGHDAGDEVPAGMHPPAHARKVARSNEPDAHGRVIEKKPRVAAPRNALAIAPKPALASNREIADRASESSA